MTTSIPGLDKPLTLEEVELINENVRQLLRVIAGLCDYVANTADRDRPPPVCFLEGFHVLQSFKSTADALEVIDKAKNK